MALYKPGKTWWVSINHGGKRLQKTTGTTDKVAAQQLHEQIKVDVWKQVKLGEQPQRTWEEAVVRWIKESTCNRKLRADKLHLRWLDQHLRGYTLSQITRAMIERIAAIKEAEGRTPATVNRLLATLSAVLRKAERDWEWLDRAPSIRKRKEDNKRIRWLTVQQAQVLLKELPPHLSDMAAFTLATGLRLSNVNGLQWTEVDLVNHHAWIHPDQAKSKKAIPVPLNTDVVAIIEKQMGNHPQFVFTYKGKPVRDCNTKAWRAALERAHIANFRWHNLRHTWASWHVQNGTSLPELQQLGGWASYDMVLRYAHLGSQQLQQAANRVCVTNLLQFYGENVEKWCPGADSNRRPAP